MDSGKVGSTRITALVSGDNAAAKDAVVTLARDIGFETVDAGPLTNARLLEPLGFLNIQLADVLGQGTQIGFKLARGYRIIGREIESLAADLWSFFDQ